MKTPCIQCSYPTNRYDRLCPNCYNVNPESTNPQSPIESMQIPRFNLTCACGEARTRALNLMCKGVGFVSPGQPKTRNQKQRDDRAFLVGDDTSQWYAKCFNCLHNDSARSPGRPSKYTDEERKWNAQNYPKIYKGRIHQKAILSYGTKGAWPACVACDQPATRVLYIGEFGKAPIGNNYWRCRRLAITDPFWHSQFMPYCDHHEVMNIGQRKKEKNRLYYERLAETTYKAERSFVDLQRTGEV